MRAAEFVSEEWSEKYKRSIDCSHPRGFSQRAHCAGRKKNEDVESKQTKYQVVCDGTRKGIFTDPARAIANAKSMFKHEKEYYHIGVENLSTGKEVWSWDKEQLDELTFKGSPCTKDCSGHRAGYEWSRRKGGVDAASWSRSFNNGAALFKNGF